MLNLAQATIIANHWLDSKHIPSGELCLLLDETIEKPYGWYFFYNSKKYLETNNIEDALMGNAPLFIDQNGNLRLTGTAEPIEFYIAEIGAMYGF